MTITECDQRRSRSIPRYRTASIRSLAGRSRTSDVRNDAPLEVGDESTPADDSVTRFTNVVIDLG